MADPLLVGSLLVGVIALLWAVSRKARSGNRPTGPDQPSGTPPPAAVRTPVPPTEVRTPLPTSTPSPAGHAQSSTPAQATQPPENAPEKLKDWSPAVVQASQIGSRFEADIRAADCSEPGGDCGFAIVGESNYQPMLRRIAKQSRNFRALLIPEPHNPYDPNAIAVWAEGGGPIGYLSRENALEYREVFAFLTERQHVGVCRAKLIGGTPGKRTYGVLIDLRETESLLTDLRDSLAPVTAVSDRVQPF
jgi:hypothetical protein